MVVRATNSCEQDSFLGFPAAGIRQVFTATFTFAITNGLIHRVWRNADDLGRLLQLRASFHLPRPGKPVYPPPELSTAAILRRRS